MLQNFFNKNFMLLLRPYDIINSDLIPVKWMIGVLLCFVDEAEMERICFGFGLRLLMQTKLAYTNTQIRHGIARARDFMAVYTTSI